MRAQFKTSAFNVCFQPATPCGGGADLEKKFLSEAAAAGLESLKGHRSVGGARASIYNAMPMEGVQALVDFMAEFKKNN